MAGSIVSLLVGGWYCFDQNSCHSRWRNTPHLMSSKHWPEWRKGCTILLYNTTRHDTTRHDTTRHDTTRHDTTRHDTTRYDTTRYDTSRHDTTRHDTIQYNIIQYNTIPIFFLLWCQNHHETRVHWNKQRTKYKSIWQ